MGRLANTVAEVTTVTGRNRLPSDVRSELMAVLAEGPRIVVCDLAGMAPAAPISHVFEPVRPYLADWPGTVVVVSVADPAAAGLGGGTAPAERLLVSASSKRGVAEARALLPAMRSAELLLAPRLTAAREARRFAARTLLGWRLPAVIDPGTVVASELVTNAIVHAVTVLALSISHADRRVRIAVRDRGGGSPWPRATPGAEPAPGGRGLVLVEAFSICWGMFPGRPTGKTVWALLEAA